MLYDEKQISEMSEDRIRIVREFNDILIPFSKEAVKIQELIIADLERRRNLIANAVPHFKFGSIVEVIAFDPSFGSRSIQPKVGMRGKVMGKCPNAIGSTIVRFDSIEIGYLENENHPYSDAYIMNWALKSC